MLQVAPDWSRTGTAREMEAELAGFKFAGPGFYLSGTSTMLVVPHDPCEDPWRNKWPPSTLFKFHWYSAPLHSTVFGASRLPPVRHDSR